MRQFCFTRSPTLITHRFIGIPLAGVICVHSEKQYAIAKLRRVNKTRTCKNWQKSKSSNCNTSSIQARMGTCISVSTGKSCAMSPS